MLQQLQSNLATGKEFCPFGSERGSQPGVHAKKEAYGLTDNLTNVLVVYQTSWLFIPQRLSILRNRGVSERPEHHPTTQLPQVLLILLRRSVI